MRRDAYIFLISAGVGVALVGGSAMIHDLRVRTVTKALNDFGKHVGFAQKIEDWREAIRSLGPKEAYRELVQRAGQFDSDQQHGLGHYFGRALYEEEGISGFSVCGDSLFGGCMHEFVAAAIQASGTDILATLNADCTDTSKNPNPTSCQHGLGHGLMNYLGYTEQNLQKALEDCSLLDSQDPTKGCYGGTFMEFNLHTVARSSNRPFSAADPYAPCDRLSAAYAPACYFWLPQWIRNIQKLPRTASETFKTLGTYCSAAPSSAYATACFQGLGYEASPAAAFDHAKARTFCDASSENQQYRDACWSVASETLQTPPIE